MTLDQIRQCAANAKKALDHDVWTLALEHANGDRERAFMLLVEVGYYVRKSGSEPA